MDPNANLKSQAELLYCDSASERFERAELRRALLDWIIRGGFEPNWKAYPDATKAFRLWRRNSAKFQDLAR